MLQQKQNFLFFFFSQVQVFDIIMMKNVKLMSHKADKNYCFTTIYEIN